ncbi:MAG: aminotransferase class V-fold PLP-dependent enzyme [Bacteroidales bacterium]|nr:aminotransferase class V-fold PLP-dependent enzyme [Bacteroidales bacterium]MBN2820415.1 aminotransferase class V-fold PLP-dependent enzyme [Bacteroidales bacterium]
MNQTYSIEKNYKTVGLSESVFKELIKSGGKVLETYSNVHRGSGHFSMITTFLFEESRKIVLKHLNLNPSDYSVVFGSKLQTSHIEKQLNQKDYKKISGYEIGISLGVVALAVRKRILKKIKAPFTGGGTARLVSREWIIWSKLPDKFEAGTPAIINIIMFAKALQLIKQFGEDVFNDPDNLQKITLDELFKDELDSLSGKELLSGLRMELIGKSVLVPTTNGQTDYINLDNAASTPSFKPVWNVFQKALLIPRQKQDEIHRKVRSICSEFFNVPQDKYDIFFTQNTTEAINIIAKGFENFSENDTVIVNTLLEHNSNEIPWQASKKLSLLRLPFDTFGFIDSGQLKHLLETYNSKQSYGTKQIKLVCITAASNVLGVFNDIGTISKLCHKYGAKLLVDGAQIAAHKSINIAALDIDFLAFSSHKTYAPFGSGALIARKGLLNLPHEFISEIEFSGYENPGGIAAMGKALDILQRIGMETIFYEEQNLIKYTIGKLRTIPGIKLYGITDTNSEHIKNRGGVLAFSLKGTMAPGIAKKLALNSGIGIRAGCHCSHLTVKHIEGIPPFAEKIQKFMVKVVPGMELPGVSRVSLGIQNTHKEIDRLALILNDMASKQNKKKVVSYTETKREIQFMIKSISNKLFETNK